MDLLNNLILGFGTALTPENLMICLIGCFVGTAVGVLPGLGPSTTIAILLPLTFALEPISALIMLAGIYYGSQYGGSTTAILMNLPGEASAVVTCVDGYQMARKGRAGPALAIAAIGSFVAGTIATLFLATLAPSLSRVALLVGPAEYFSLILLGLVGVVVLAKGSLLKAFAVLIVGIMLGTVGIDPTSGTSRFTFGFIELSDGVAFTALALGFFAFGEIISNLAKPADDATVETRIDRLLPNRTEMAEATPAILRGTAVGSLLGLLPGGGATLSAWIAYVLEKRISRRPQEFGQGAVRGLAAPESANNAAVQTSFIPMLTLGIPTNLSMAMMIGAMLMHNIVPGPQVMTSNPTLFWGLIASMWIGNLMLLVLNLPLVGLWVRLLRIPYEVLFPAIILICCIGVYTVSGRPFDIFIAAFFGLCALIFVKLDCEIVPLLLGFILGPMLEGNFRRSMLISKGDPLIFLNSWLSVVLLLAAVALIIVAVLPNIRRNRETVFEEA